MSERDLGYLTATQDAQGRQIDDFREDMRRIEGKIDGLVEQFASLRGGKKMFFTIVFAAGGIATAVVEFLRWAHFWPPK